MTDEPTPNPTGAGRPITVEEGRALLDLQLGAQAFQFGLGDAVGALIRVLLRSGAIDRDALRAELNVTAADAAKEGGAVRARPAVEFAERLNLAGRTVMAQDEDGRVLTVQLPH